MIRIGRVRIEINRAGVREAALTGDAVRDLILSRARRVADAANTRYRSIEVGGRDVGDSPTRVRASAKMGEGRSRARARVVADHPASLAIEAKHRVLGHSVDAAR